MTFAISASDGMTVIEIEGDLDSAEVKDLRPDIDQAVAESLPIIFDLSKVEFIDSAGIGLIVHTYKMLAALKLGIAVSGAMDQPLELLEATQLNRFMPFKPTLDEAKAALS